MDDVLKEEDKPVDLHKRAMDDYELAETAWAENRKAALEDIKFRAGDHWPEEIKQARSQLGKERPMLVVDKLNQYVRQVVNDARQNRPAIKIRPVDDEGDQEIAEAFQGIIRHIYERSNGDLATDNSIEGAVVNGYGYTRIRTDYANANTFNQEILVERVGNPLSVMLGLPGEEPLKASFCFIVDEMPKKQFKKKYPNAKYSDFDSKNYADGWTHDEYVRFCEYFYVDEEMETTHLLEDGTVISEDDYQIAVKEGQTPPAIVESRELPQREVKWCRISGAEVLEENEWLGKYIPITRTVGNEYNIDGKVIYSGLIRAAKDPQRLYDYSRSAFAERVALTPKSPWMIAEGQLEGHEEEWQNAHLEPAILTYKETSLDGHPVPPPQRVSATDIPEGFARDMTLAEHDIQASMGMYSASIGQAGNERSGKAIMARQREGDTATFHYQDNAAREQRDIGTILVDLIPKVYDSKRVVRILGVDGQSERAEIDPDQEQPVVRMGSKVIYNLGVGEYDVSVDVGPSYNTKRVEQSEAMMELVHNSPEIMQIAGDLVVKSQDWPEADELAERFRLMLPPPIQQSLQKQGNLSPDAQAIKAQADMAMQQKDAQIQEMGKAMEQAQQSVMKLELQVKDNADKVQVDMLKLQIDQFKAETDRMQAAAAASQTPADTSAFDQLKLQYEDKWKQLDADVKIAVAELQSKTQLTTASMSANASSDGSSGTVLDAEGTPQASPALAALVEVMNQNLITLTQSHQVLADGMSQMAMAAKAPRVARRDKAGNLYSEVVQ